VNDKRKQLEDAHNSIKVESRKRVRLLNGEIKDFIDIKPNDVFQIIYPDGSIESLNRKGKSVNWFKCTVEPYLNDEFIPTIQTENVYGDPTSSN
jgi:hypothetical protein